MLLNAHTFFSHTYGTLSVKQLVAESANLGYNSICLTDINNTCAQIDFVDECNNAGLKPLLGIDFRNMDESAHCLYIGIAKNALGLFELNSFLSEHLHAKKPFPKRAPNFENAFIIYPFRNIPYSDLPKNAFIGIKPENISRLIQVPEDLLKKKSVALYPVGFKDKGDFYLHCLLRSVGLNTLLSKLKPEQAASRNECLISVNELTEIYKPYPYLLQNTQNLIDECEINFDFKEEKNKQLFYGSADEDFHKLREMCYMGLGWRYGNNNEEAIKRLEKELNVIRDKNFVAYFLTAWDIIKYAKLQKYFHAGRGSGANSIAAYCLGITEVDPIALNLYFERFLNMHRSSPPDFDIDFSWKDREDVTRYIFERNGSENTALLGAHSTFQFRAIVRELGKVYGLPSAEIENLSRTIEIENRTKIKKSDALLDVYKNKILAHGQRLTKFPQHLTVHSSGIVISDKPLYFYTATDMPPKGYQTTHFDMYTADKFKMHKLDILSQRGLGHIKDCIKIVKENRGEDIDINRINDFKEDPNLNHLLSTGNSIGCFYIESPAMRQLLRKVRCDKFETLVAASSIIRPGVSDSGMMRTYIQRVREPDRYQAIHPKMEKILGETYGVMCYQEDIIRVAHEFAEMSLNGADILRRAMAWKHRVDDGFERMKKEYFENCYRIGYPEDVIQEVWRQMEGFAGFSFCKAHSASYAVESYQSLFLKAYYPLEFMVAVINNFGGYYDTEFYVNEARRYGGNIKAPCVNRGEYFTCIDGTDIYMGFIHIKSLQSGLAQNIEIERNKNGLYKDLADFAERLKVGREQLLILVRIGAFRFTGKTKRQLLWETLLLTAYNGKPKNASESLFKEPVKAFNIPRISQSFREDALQEIELLGFPLCSRFSLLSKPARAEIYAQDMINHIGKSVKMLGYLTNTKTKKTIKGTYMQFGSFIDEESQTFETTLFPQIYARFPFTERGIYLLYGKVMDDYDVCSLELQKWERLDISFDPNLKHFSDEAYMEIDLDNDVKQAGDIVLI
jgi:DNA polymerase-3 subunit alpha